jgi:3-isopropylmalate/(R)-2-methylmalate dehydratase small subunit
MEAFTKHSGRAVCIARENIDTDQIVPARFCKRITKTGFADALFAHWRDDPDFVLNDPKNAGANFLVAGANFGIGSSREHAVWALRDFGFKAVISSSFGEIFQNNALKNGLLPVVLPASAVDDLRSLVECDPALPVAVDLLAKNVRAGNASWSFDVDEEARQMILNGLDEIDLTMQRSAGLAEYEASRPAWLPSIGTPDTLAGPTKHPCPR